MESEFEQTPTKCIEEELTINVAAKIVYVDFTGRADRQSIIGLDTQSTLLRKVAPRQLVLLGSDKQKTSAINSFYNKIGKSSGSSSSATAGSQPKMIAAEFNKKIDVSSETHIFVAQLAPNLLNNLYWQSVGPSIQVAVTNAQI